MKGLFVVVAFCLAFCSASKLEQPVPVEAQTRQGVPDAMMGFNIGYSGSPSIGLPYSPYNAPSMFFPQVYHGDGVTGRDEFGGFGSGPASGAYGGNHLENYPGTSPTAAGAVSGVMGGFPGGTIATGAGNDFYPTSQMGNFQNTMPMYGASTSIASSYGSAPLSALGAPGQLGAFNQPPSTYPDNMINPAGPGGKRNAQGLDTIQ
eukprot:gnl/Spiro4/26703_TR13267_c0_g1_i1.p1 gnl/Spiro4/26703_TR13267_c0_g1~~gnl/Spiro4/26703_TR13267_c0_g1_i1.p1  ORF type:complete len:219 (-),score=37.59 gnl/Spiro4/26703_TR13267_c0_g1_i1:105-719(-)